MTRVEARRRLASGPELSLVLPRRRLGPVVVSLVGGSWRATRFDDRGEVVGQHKARGYAAAVNMACALGGDPARALEL